MNLTLNPLANESFAQHQMRFQPYSDNGGTTVAIAGEDFAIMASDTRLSEGYSIHTRDSPKIHKMTEKSVIGMVGCQCDVLTLQKLLKAKLQVYKHDHRREISTPALASMLSATLYSRRFFPYYVNNTVAGLDEEGRGCVFSYDPIGSCEREKYTTGGSASAFLHPLLDNQIDLKNQEGVKFVPLSEAKALLVIKDVLISAAERDIFTGDAIAITIINKDGMREERFELRKD